jgi:hypothetical protein
MREFRNRNRGNQAASAAKNDLYFNAASARLQTESDVNYARTMMPYALEYQRTSQDIATVADQRRMASEGAIVRDLTDQQGRISRDLANINNEGVRYIADRRVDESRLTADAGVRSTQIGADAQRDVAGTQLRGTRYTADAGVRSTQIGADAQRDVAGIQRSIGQDSNLSQERQRRIQGEEDRRTLAQGTDETLRLRADARGAIASKGRRFFG